jgi:hypothetical protein
MFKDNNRGFFFFFNIENLVNEYECNYFNLQFFKKIPQKWSFFVWEKWQNLVFKKNLLITHFNWLENIGNHDMIKYNPFLRP